MRILKLVARPVERYNFDKTWEANDYFICNLDDTHQVLPAFAHKHQARTYAKQNNIALLEDGMTFDQMQALLDFRLQHGRYWKQVLRVEWERDTHKNSALFRQLRNQLGPDWLKYFKLPKETA